MTRILTDGAEFGDILLFEPGTTVGLVASGAVKRSGNYSYETKSVFTYGNGRAYISIPADAEYYFRIAVLTTVTSSNQRQINWCSGYTILGNLEFVINRYDIYIGGVWVASGAPILWTNVWYVVEVHVKIVNGAGGVVEVKIDGIPYVSYSGDTQPGALTTIDKIYFYAWYNSGDGINRTFYIDDLAVNNTAGAVDNSWCSDGRIICLKPNADGDKSELHNTALTHVNNWSYVDETPADGDTSWVQGNVVDEEDLYDLEDMVITDADILRVWAEARSRDTLAVGGEVALVLKTHATEYVGADLALLNTFTQRVLGTEEIVNPFTAGVWSIAELDDLQAGPRTRT